MDLILAYLKIGKLPKDKTKTRVLIIKVGCYVVYNDKLYKKGYSMLLLRCVTPSKVDYIMR